MKRILLGLAALALLITSCQKNDVKERLNYDDGSLNFGVNTAKTMKAAEMTNDYLKLTAINDATGIPLYAYVGAMDATKTAYFTDRLTWDATNNKWTTKIPHFLPDDGSVLQFFAYYPKTNITNYTYADLTANKYPKFDYKVQPIATQEDLVAAMIKNNTNKDITIQLQHILSQVNFGIKGYYGAKITISNIVINDVFEAGSFDYTDFANNPAPLSCWTPTTAIQDYVYPFAKTNATPNTFTTPGTDVYNTTEQEDNNIYILGDGGNWGKNNTGDEIFYVLNDGTAKRGSAVVVGDKLSNSLILLPQTLAAAANVTFKYKVQDLDGNYIAGSATKSVDGKFDLATAGVTTWDPNLRYIYIIDFNLKDNLLTFDVDVEALPWENYDWGGTPGNGTGIVDIKSLGDIFNTSVKVLTVGGTYTLPSTPDYQLFNNITWNWSNYTMTNTFAGGDKFYVVLGTNVKFNGHTLTIKAPKGFKVTTPTHATPATEVVMTFNEIVTFIKD